MRRPRPQGLLRAGSGLTLLAVLLSSCGFADSAIDEAKAVVEDVVEEFVDDQDYELYAGQGSIATLARAANGLDVALLQDAMQPGDTDADHQALAVVGFAFDRDVQPDRTRLESIQLRFWLEPGAGDVSPLGPLVVSHFPVTGDLLDVSLVPDPPGNDVATIQDVTSSGWRQVDVSEAFLAAWHANRKVAAFALRFATPTDGESDFDFVDLFPEGDGEVKRPHLILQFRVNL